MPLNSICLKHHVQIYQRDRSGQHCSQLTNFFINIRELNRSSPVVDRKFIFTSFRWLWLHSFSQVLTGRVSAMFSRTKMFRYFNRWQQNELCVRLCRL